MVVRDVLIERSGERDGYAEKQARRLQYHEHFSLTLEVGEKGVEYIVGVDAEEVANEDCKDPLHVERVRSVAPQGKNARTYCHGRIVMSLLFSYVCALLLVVVVVVTTLPRKIR